MRAIVLSLSFLILAAGLWAVQASLQSYVNVKRLASPAADTAACEDALRDAGAAAVPALRAGLAGKNPVVRLRCARVLAQSGDRDGDGCLLAALSTYGKDAQDPVGGLAEALLLSVWDTRGAPPAAWRARVARLAEENGRDREQQALLNECLSRYQNWSAGFVRRAQVYQRHGRHLDACREALNALKVDPDSFEAMVLLAEAYRVLDAPEQAFICMQQAVRVNPRLRAAHADDIRDILKAVERDRLRRRQLKRREQPVT
jgi:tetratricopeptide (TPR) repeat protein